MSSKRVMVSVILPTYNRAHLIEKSIQSVLQQTYTNFELLIVDDGSSDNTDEVVQNIDDPRIKYIKCTENKGANVARNIGIKAAQGEYIAFQDSDDEWYTNKLEMHIEAFDNTSSETGIVYTGFYKITGDKKVYIPTEKFTHRDGDIHREVLKGGFIGTPAVLVKRTCFDVVGGFDEALPRLQDWELFIRLSKEFKYKYIDKASFNAYHTPVSITTNEQALYESLEIILKKYKNDYSKNKKELAGFFYSIGVWNCEKTDFKKGRNYLIKAIRSYPYNLKYYIRYIISSFGQKFYKEITSLLIKGNKI